MDKMMKKIEEIMTEYIATEDFIYDDIIIKKNEKLEIYYLDDFIYFIKIPNNKLEIINIHNNGNLDLSIKIDYFFKDKIEKGIIITLADYRNYRIEQILE
jgi:hypothetical protein